MFSFRLAAVELDFEKPVRTADFGDELSREVRRQLLPPDFATELIAEVCRPDWLFEVELDGRRAEGTHP